MLSCCQLNLACACQMVQAQMLRNEQWQHLQNALRCHWHHLKRQQHLVLHLPSMPLGSWWQQQQGRPEVHTLAGQAPHQLWRLLGFVQETTLHEVQPFKAAGNDINAKQQHTLRTNAAPGMAGVIKCQSSDPSNNLCQAVCSETGLGAQKVLVLASSACDSVMDSWMQLMGRMSGVDLSTVGRWVASALASL